MAKSKLSPAIIAQFSDRAWRLNNLYWIEDAYGQVVKFQMNAAQRRLFDDMHYLNLTLKARQMGFCLDPETRVLTANLRWKPIADLRLGEELVAVDEYPIGKGKGQHRKMRTGFVEGLREVEEEAFRITFDDGRSVVCTGRHRWMTREINPVTAWRSVEGHGKMRLKVGTQVRWVTKPWGEPTYEDGWFGGLVDGEGSIAKSNTSAGINVSQRRGHVWDRMMSYGLSRGYRFKIEEDAAGRPSKFGEISVPKMNFGRMDELFRLIGQTRPARFIGNRFWEGRELPGKKSGIGWATVVSIESVGVQRMIDLQTSTSTFIAEGFVSHNSTFILLMALDCCLWNDHFAAGLIADTMVNAMNLLKRVKFAYEHVPEQIRQILPLKSDNQTGMEFANGSSISVGVSLRSGTFNFIHISEYGKICAKAPDKAAEIKSGSLNTLAPRQLAFIESTAEGKGGDFYDKTQLARKLIDAKREPSELEYKFHFFPWFEDPKYRSETPFLVDAENLAYFAKLYNEHGVELSEPQKWWYCAKKLEQGDDMLKEFPSTPDEAFEGAMDGAVYGREMRKLRLRNKIGRFPYVPGIAVNTFWDFGVGDAQSIWLHQEVAGEHNFIGFYEDSGEALAHYWDWLTTWRVTRSAVWGVHYAPHDVDHRRQGATEIQTLKQMAAGIGLDFTTVERTPTMKMAIMAVRQKLPGCNFDEGECAAGIEHMEQYAYEWDDKMGVWKSEPRHDQHSHAEAAFRTFADGYAPEYKGTLAQIEQGGWAA